MHEVISLCAGLGVLLVYDGATRATRAVSLGQRFRRAVEPRPIISSVVAMLVASALLGWPGGTLLGGGIATALEARRRAIARKIADELVEAWPDAIDHLVARLRAGASLAEACIALAAKGPAPLAPAWHSFARDYRLSGNIESSLERLRGAMADPACDRVVASLLLAHRVGGTETIRALRNLAAFLRADLRTRREVEARWSWTITAARLATAAPWVVLGLMSLRPEAARAYASSGGAIVIVGGALSCALGYRLMLRAARLPELERVLR